MSATDTLIKTQIEINFSIPTAAATDVIGTDVDSGDTQFVFQTPNSIIDITNLEDPTETHLLFTLRLNNNRTRIGTSRQFLTTFNGDRRPIFGQSGKGIAAGQVKFVSQQPSIGGGLEAHELVITTATPLVA